GLFADDAEVAEGEPAVLTRGELELSRVVGHHTVHFVQSNGLRVVHVELPPLLPERQTGFGVDGGQNLLADFVPFGDADVVVGLNPVAEVEGGEQRRRATEAGEHDVAVVAAGGNLLTVGGGVEDVQLDV